MLFLELSQLNAMFLLNSTELYTIDVLYTLVLVLQELVELVHYDIEFFLVFLQLVDLSANSFLEVVSFTLPQGLVFIVSSLHFHELELLLVTLSSELIIVSF